MCLLFQITLFATSSYVLKEYLVYLAETRHPDILYKKVNWKFFCIKITVEDELPRPAPTPDRK